MEGSFNQYDLNFTNRDGTKQAKYRCNFRQNHGPDACHVKPINKDYIEGSENSTPG